uniref:Uncharacterized protein n=1 Tax=Glossina brevipalpis TaxID=37001 RepID=A0A1A9WGV1_9MUSC
CSRKPLYRGNNIEKNNATTNNVASKHNEDFECYDSKKEAADVKEIQRSKSDEHSALDYLCPQCSKEFNYCGRKGVIKRLRSSHCVGMRGVPINSVYKPQLAALAAGNNDDQSNDPNAGFLVSTDDVDYGEEFRTQALWCRHINVECNFHKRGFSQVD